MVRVVGTEDGKEEGLEMFSKKKKKKKMQRGTLILFIWDNRAVHFMTR